MSLAAAKQNLEQHFLLAGLVERFDETLLLLKRALGWRCVVYDRTNVSPSAVGGPVSQETVEAIRERNRLDADLYDHCTRLFDERRAAAGPDFQRELWLFKLRNAPYDRVVSSARWAGRSLAACL